jgi:hypothetical protein
MGVDVQFGVEGAEWKPDHSLAKRIYELLDVETFVKQLPSGWLKIGSLERYYGPGYERGSWPRIYGALRALQAMYPGHRVTYGGDNFDVEESSEVTPELLDEYWTHWLGPDGDAYHDRHAPKETT